MQVPWREQSAGQAAGEYSHRSSRNSTQNFSPTVGLVSTHRSGAEAYTVWPVLALT